MARELISIPPPSSMPAASSIPLDKVRWLPQDETLPGYDALSTNEVVAALDEADVSAIKRVRGDERKFGARRRVLDEVTRLHRERRGR